MAQTQGQAIIDSLSPLLTKAIKSGYIRELQHSINPDSGLKYANLQLHLAEKLKWESGMGWANETIYEVKG